MAADPESFAQYRSLLFFIAYRLLGSVMDAEDMVQETYLRWQRERPEEIQSPKAYLTTIISRLCIDHLRSARVRREAYVGPWLPEPLITHAAQPSADDYLILAESLSTAFLVLLETLTPIERAVFLLRDVFDCEYAEIGLIVDKSEANCRQLAKRAREHISSRRPGRPATRERQAELAAQFARTCAEGDLPGLIQLLSEDIVAYSDGGGRVRAALNPIYGPERVARFLMGLMGKLPAGSLSGGMAEANGQAAILLYVDGRPYCAITFDILATGLIRGLYLVLNPDKLRDVPPAA